MERRVMLRTDGVRRVRFFTAPNLVNRLEKSQTQYRLDRFLTQVGKTGLSICDEIG